MRLFKTIFIWTVLYVLLGCSADKPEEKGFAVTPSTQSKDQDKINGISSDSLILATRPSSVLLTGIAQYRLTTIYKVNYRDDSTTFIGSNAFYGNYSDLGTTAGNQWNAHLMPGLEAVYGYNMVNISHYNTATHTQKFFFEKPVLIRTLYYPAFSKDTLNEQVVNRNYFLTSVYDEDTNKDGFINVQDLRRFYYFDMHAKNRKALIPSNYSVVKSEYDPANDWMYVFAHLDENGDGKGEEKEAMHIFWIDLNNPLINGRHY